MDPLASALARRLRRARLLGPRTHALIGLSGGLDSVVLLHLLRFGLPWPLRLTAAHLDHALRAGSAADAAWVMGLCGAWQVELLRARARTAPVSETQAREVRHAFLRRARRRVGADWIVLAHHADDQAETVLFRLARGTGVPGLAGIPPRRGRILRPLLSFTRAELRAYAERHRLSWREDPSNLDARYARNRIRHTVLPALEAAVPGAAAALVRLADAVRADERAWEEELARIEKGLAERRPDGTLALARDQLLAYHPIVRTRLLRRALRRYGSRPHRAGTRAALEFISTAHSGSGIDLPGGVRLEREFDRLTIRRGVAAAPMEPNRELVIPAPDAGSGEAVIGGRRFTARWGPDPGGEAGGAVVFGLGGLRFPLRLRGWRPGDRIRLRGGSAKLKKLFGERRVPRSERERIPVLVDAEGAVLWLAGLASAAEVGPGGAKSLFYLTIGDVEPG
jgi:tRNA(Ile)-lysidine synthase